MCHHQCIEELTLMTRYASLELQLQVSAVALLFGVLLAVDLSGTSFTLLCLFVHTFCESAHVNVYNSN
jgi:hypothetical protein